MRILVTGGARSGKSRHAQALAESLASERIYLATGQAFDAEMADRIRRHQADRDASWRTIEAPLDVIPHLSAGPVVLLDCLTLWVSNLLHHGAPDGVSAAPPLDLQRAALVQAVRDADNHVILVTNEVGLGVVPMNPLARRFRDEAGWLAQDLAQVCDQVHLCVAGIPMTVKG
jgi:adenosylcobinamide kinase/adenosylcobinamide-phosphate guanylyltransferase